MTSSRRRLERAYLFQSSDPALIALLFVVSAIGFFAEPGVVDSAIGVVHPFDYYWSAFYLLGGVAVVYGVLSRRVIVEAAGQVLLVPGLVLNFIIATHVLGVHAVTFLTAILAAGRVFRALGLVMGWQEAHDG